MGQELGSKEKLPFWEQYLLSINEAAEYFNIGKDKIRRIIKENPDAKFILWNGTRAQIKRKKFEQLIDEVNTLYFTPAATN